MSGELGAYDVVNGNEGDRNDLDLWYKGGSLVSAYVPCPHRRLMQNFR